MANRILSHGTAAPHFLGDVSIVLPDSDSFGSNVERISYLGTAPVLTFDSSVTLADPWGNQVSLALGPSGSRS